MLASPSCWYEWEKLGFLALGEDFDALVVSPAIEKGGGDEHGHRDEAADNDGGNARSLHDEHGQECHQGDVDKRYEDPGESGIFQCRGAELGVNDAQQQHSDAHNTR